MCQDVFLNSIKDTSERFLWIFSYKLSERVYENLWFELLMKWNSFQNLLLHIVYWKTISKDFQTRYLDYFSEEKSV